MRRLPRSAVVAGLAIVAACADDTALPTAPAPVQRSEQSAPERDSLGVGTLGTVTYIHHNDKWLEIEQFGFEYVPPPNAKFDSVRHTYAVGRRKDVLRVHLKKDTTGIFLNGKGDPVPLDSIKVGHQLLVVGQVNPGGQLHADYITDLTVLTAPTPEMITRLPDPGALISNPRVTPAASRAVSLCMGQDLAFDETNVLDFQGCWGGPSASDDLDTPFIPLLCPLIGCFGIDRFSYTMAVGGWGFAFPFRLSASTPQELVYHVPGDVSLRVEPLAPTVGAFSFAGGLGIDFGLNIDFCSFFGCYDITTIHLSAFSMIHQARGAPPLEGRMEIGETSCPSIGFFPIEGVPIDPLSIGLCEDLGLNGRPFYSTVTSIGAANPAVAGRFAFESATKTVRLRPDAMQVSIRFDEFTYTPFMTMGLYFRFKVFQIPVWDTPSIPFGETGSFPAVPLGPMMTVATDPLSSPPDLRYRYQPTTFTRHLSVAPAQTVVAIMSGEVLTEGTPVTLRLTEAYDGSPIANQPVALTATGLSGTASSTGVAITDADGRASVLLPVGEYRLDAVYRGSDTYSPSSAEQPLVTVYRPTTFVVWGGNPGGIVVGARHQFWGHAWAKQVVGGSWGGNSSFQGFAIPLTKSTWMSPPASSGPGPASIPDLIGVIVTTEVGGRGSNAVGNIAAHAILRVDDPSAYRPNGGHPSTGVVRMMLP